MAYWWPTNSNNVYLHDSIKGSEIYLSTSFPESSMDAPASSSISEKHCSSVVLGRLLVGSSVSLVDDSSL